ncbi:MAG: hypothetical protein ACRC5T_05280 [Cetobacterium sp.]
MLKAKQSLEFAIYGTKKYSELTKVIKELEDFLSKCEYVNDLIVIHVLMSFYQYHTEFHPTSNLICNNLIK